MTYRLRVDGTPKGAQVLLNLPDGAIKVTEWPTVEVKPGGPLWKSYGVCSHPNFANAAYGDTDAWTQRLADLGVYAFRGLAASNLLHVKRTAARARELGLKWIASVATLKMTEKQVRANLEFVAANADVFIAVEGVNEPDHDGLTNAEVAKTVTYQKIIWDFVAARPELADIVVLAPALRKPAPPEMYQRFADAGILGLYDAVSLHHYLTGPPNVAELSTEHIDYVADKWQCDRIWISETGGTTALESTDPRRNTEDALAAYSIPTIFEYLSDERVEFVCRYEAMDDEGPLTNNEAYFGLFRADGSEKPEVAMIRAFVGMVRDDAAAFAPPPAELEVIAPDGVRWRVTQTSTRPPVLWLWRPGVDVGVESVLVDVATPTDGWKVAVGAAAVGIRLAG